jgi:hypothetical protein
VEYFTGMEERDDIEVEETISLTTNDDEYDRWNIRSTMTNERFYKDQFKKFNLNNFE